VQTGASVLISWGRSTGIGIVCAGRPSAVRGIARFGCQSRFDSEPDGILDAFELAVPRALVANALCDDQCRALSRGGSGDKGRVGAGGGDGEGNGVGGVGCHESRVWVILVLFEGAAHAEHRRPGSSFGGLEARGLGERRVQGQSWVCVAQGVDVFNFLGARGRGLT